MATKIGVYFDRAAIGGGLDIEALMDDVSTKWKDLTPVVKDLFVMSSDESISEIKSDIAENELDGVLLCGGSGRLNWDRYDFGVKLQVEHVNLREGCVLAYQNPDGSTLSGDPDDEAPELLRLMATDYINMGVAKIERSKLPTADIEEEIKFKTILVIGGGWTGLNAAIAASKAGYEVALIEKEAELGGNLRNMHKTVPLTAPFTTPQETGLEDLVAQVNSDAKIKVLLSSELTSLAGAPGRYVAHIKTAKGETNLEIGSVVLAAGWKPLEGEHMAPLGYGKSPRIVTAQEFEIMARDNKIDCNRVAFLLNINKCIPEVVEPTEEELEALRIAEEEAEKAAAKSDEVEIVIEPFKDMETPKHLIYSNSVSSVVALKQASYVAEKPQGIAYILYDDMTVQGIYERFYKETQNHNQIFLSKAKIDEVRANGDDSILVRASDTLLGSKIDIEVDMVVLPTGMVPATAKSPIMEFAYRQGPAFPDLDLFDGYADSNYVCFPYETRRTGVYAAGSVRQPMTLSHALEDANGAVLKAIQCIESVTQGVAVHPRSGDRSYPVFNMLRCTQCKRCTEECPFGALDDDEKGTPLPNTSRCRRCGTCMGACPERVISFEDYNVDQIGTMIRNIYVPDDMAEGGPRVLILACENDAYPAFDMAAMQGMSWNPYVRIIPVRCLGSINAIWIADAMSKGIDGVMLMGCKYGDDYQCHFIKGSEICNRRSANIAETLNRLGIEAERVEQFEVAIDEYNDIPGMIGDFMEMIYEKGPNPFKGY